MRSRVVHLLLAGIVAAGVVGCKRETPPQQESPQQNVEATTIVDPPVDLEGKRIDTVIPLRHPLAEGCEVGSQLNEENVVAEKKSELRKGEKIYFTMRLNESPAGLQTALAVRGPDGKEIGRLLKNVGGEKLVTFQLDRPLDPGKYVLEGYWGGNSACEEEITILER